VEFTRTLLEREIEEKTSDLEAFTRAREIIRQRVLEVRDSQSPLTPLPTWSGTDAVLGALDLSIHAMEGTIAELRALLSASPAQRLTLIPGGHE
jgi:hypothetical protein